MVVFNWGTESNGVALLSWGAGTCSASNMSTDIVLTDTTTWTNIQPYDIIAIWFTYAGSNKYIVTRVESKPSSLHLTVYVPWYQGPLSGMSFMYGTPTSLGAIKSVSMELTSDVDPVGMPCQSSKDTLTLPFNGVVRRITVEGFFKDTAPFVYGASLMENMQKLEARIQSDQSPNALGFYHFRFTEQYSRWPMLFFCDLDSVVYKDDETTPNTFKYTMKLVEKFQ